MTILYREDDPISARWAGLGRLLTKYEMDHNHYQFDQRIGTLEGNYALTVSIDTITQPTPSELLFTMTDATTRGPFTLPSSVLRDRGDWAIDTPYLVNDTFQAADGGLYRVIFDHTSSHTSFSPTANDGMGHDYYAKMISAPGNALPAGGAANMMLRKSTGVDYVVSWAYPLPTGGTTNKVLAKLSNTNQDADWTTLRANLVTFSPSSDSTLISTNVADALEELETKIAAEVDDAADVTFTPSTDSDLTSTNVADALAEVENNIPDVSGYATIDSPTFTGTPTAPTASPGDDGTSIATTAFVTAAIAAIPVSLTIAASDETTALTTGTAKVTFRMPHAMTVSEVRGALSTAQASGSIFTVDVNEAGVSILSTKITLDNTEKTSTTAATPAVISDTSLADDAEITIDIDQIGASGAKGLKVTLIGTR